MTVLLQTPGGDDPDPWRGLLNRATLGRLPRGACVVRAARGRHLVAADLIALLDSGHLAEATLDVTDPEPLPPGDPLWDHPRVLLTPHIAAVTDPRTAVGVIAANIGRLDRGETPAPRVDPEAGYEAGLPPTCASVYLGRAGWFADGCGYGDHPRGRQGDRDDAVRHCRG